VPTEHDAAPVQLSVVWFPPGVGHWISAVQPVSKTGWGMPPVPTSPKKDGRGALADAEMLEVLDALAQAAGLAAK